MKTKDRVMESLDSIHHYSNSSKLKYNQSGQLYFDDKLYITKWTVTDRKLSSNTQFVSSEAESLHFDIAALASIQSPQSRDGWFAFQGPLHDELLSPYHRNKHLELYIVTKGSFKIKVQKDFHTLKAGSALLINANTNHSDVIAIEPMELYIIGFNASFFEMHTYQELANEDLRQFLSQTFQAEKKNSEAWFIETNDQGHSLQCLAEQMRTELTLRHIGYASMTSVYGQRILDSLSKMTVTVLKDATRNHKLLVFHEITQYLEHTYKTANLNDLADYLKFSSSYVNRIIKEISGKTYTEFLQTVRIEKAASMLKHTDKPIAEIINDVGYTNVTYFYELFKAYKGHTPKAYREKTNL